MDNDILDTDGRYMLMYELFYIQLEGYLGLKAHEDLSLAGKRHVDCIVTTGVKLVITERNSQGPKMPCTALINLNLLFLFEKNCLCISKSTSLVGDPNFYIHILGISFINYH